MLCKLHTAIRSNRAHQIGREGTEELNHTVAYMSRSFLGDFQGQQEAGFSASQCNQTGRTSLTRDGIHFPMSQFRTIICGLRPLFNGMTDTKLAPRFFFALFPACLAAMTELTCKAAFAMG